MESSPHISSIAASSCDAVRRSKWHHPCAEEPDLAIRPYVPSNTSHHGASSLLVEAGFCGDLHFYGAVSDDAVRIGMGESSPMEGRPGMSS